MSLFASTKVAGVSFAQPGRTVTGRITEIGDQFHADKYRADKSRPAEKDYWPSGDPVMNVTVTLQTQERDPSDQDDEGLRRLFITVSGKEGGLLWAIRQAVKAAGLKDLAVGGTLAVRMTGFDPKSQNPAQPRKIYEAQYQPPVGGGAFDTALSQPVQNGGPQWGQLPPLQTQSAAGPVQAFQQAPQQFVSEQPPFQQQVPQPAPQPQVLHQGQPVNTATGELLPSDPPVYDIARGLIAIGKPDADIAAATGLSLEQVAVLKAAPPA